VNAGTETAGSSGKNDGINPFFQVDGSKWRLAHDDSKSLCLIHYRNMYVSMTCLSELSESPFRILNNETGSVGYPARFNFTNASAFLVWGATRHNRKNFQVTVIPPTSEGLPRTRVLSDWIEVWDNANGDFELDSLHYIETGLNRNSTYQVEWVNPELSDGSQNLVDIRYVEFVDAPP
jgi:hypothetical protein